MKITFWMKAFIPYHVPGVTKIIPNSDNESMVIGPPELNTAPRSVGETVKSAVIPGYGVYDSFRRYGYRTDQRSFDSNYNAKSRMNCAFNLILNGDDLRNAQLDAAAGYNHCDQTVAVDVETGAVLKTGNASNENMSFTQGTVTSDCFNIYMSMAAADPVVLGATAIANINFSGNISIQPVIDRRHARYNWSLSTSILLDNFPAFEAYAAINEKRAFAIFQTMPLPGYTVADLIDVPVRGTHYGAGIYAERSRIERHTIIDTDADGAFDTLR
jgi:hypothetical protein